MSIIPAQILPSTGSGFVTNDVILHVEDSEIDHEALKRAYQRVGIKTPLFWCTDVKDAEDFLSHQGRYGTDGIQVPRPSIILLDLNLPGEDGRSLLKRLKKNPKFSTIPIVVLSSSSNPKDVEQCYSLGANAYLLKPLDPKDLEVIILAFGHFWLKHNIFPSPLGTCARSNE